MNDVPGTRGYESSLDAFVDATNSLDFEAVNRHFLHLLPASPCRVLDAGAGIGQNAAELASRGHSVVAVEPLAAFLRHARSTYGSQGVTWVECSLPALEALGEAPAQFDFILVQGVWHHLDEAERRLAMLRLSRLLGVGGICAITLRHGPAGAGAHVFPTDGEATRSLAEACGMEEVVHLTDQPSLLENKRSVTWTHLAFRQLGRPLSD